MTTQTSPARRRPARGRSPALLVLALALAFTGCSCDEPCPPGHLGCPCAAGGECLASADGVALVCLEGTCRAGNLSGAGVTVAAAEARGCDVVVSTGGGLVEASFGAGVIGEVAADRERLALSFIHEEDLALPSPAAQLTSSGAESPVLLEAHCFDRLGRPIAEPGVTLR